MTIVPPPECPLCGGLIRPGAVWFGESLPEAAWEAAYSVRLAAAFDSFAGTDTTVIWLGHVRTTDDRVGLTNRRVHRLASDLAEARDHVLVADLAELLDSGEEAATRCLLEDGLHLTAGCLTEAATGLEALLPDVP